MFFLRRVSRKRLHFTTAALPVLNPIACPIPQAAASIPPPWLQAADACSCQPNPSRRERPVAPSDCICARPRRNPGMTRSPVRVPPLLRHGVRPLPCAAGARPPPPCSTHPLRALSPALRSVRGPALPHPYLCCITLPEMDGGGSDGYPEYLSQPLPTAASYFALAGHGSASGMPALDLNFQRSSSLIWGSTNRSSM